MRFSGSLFPAERIGNIGHKNRNAQKQVIVFVVLYNEKRKFTGAQRAHFVRCSLNGENIQVVASSPTPFKLIVL